MKEGLELIGLERKRQVNEEGWTPEHDDGHHGRELALAAACYAAGEPVYVQRFFDGDEDHMVDAWPWECEFDKREKHERIKQLAIAGALIAAEIERLIRLQSKEEGK
jgi:hypothetical protein